MTQPQLAKKLFRAANLAAAQSFYFQVNNDTGFSLRQPGQSEPFTFLTVHEVISFLSGYSLAKAQYKPLSLQ